MEGASLQASLSSHRQLTDTVESSWGTWLPLTMLASTMRPLVWDTEGKAFSGVLATPGLGYVLALVKTSNGSRMLVPVCDRSWGDGAARVACNLAGFKYGAAVPTGGTTGRTQITTLTLAPMFDQVNCYAAAGSTNATAAFATCDGTWYQWGTCNGVAAVMCSNEAFSPPPPSPKPSPTPSPKPKPGKKPTKKPTPSSKPSPSPAPATVTAKFVNKASVSTCAANVKSSNTCNDLELIVDDYKTVVSNVPTYPSMCFRVTVKKTTSGCGSAAGLQELRIPVYPKYDMFDDTFKTRPSCEDITLKATVNEVPASLVATCTRDGEDAGMQYLSVSLAGLTAAQVDGALVCVEDAPASDSSEEPDLQRYFLDMSYRDFIPGSTSTSGEYPGMQYTTSSYYYSLPYTFLAKGSSSRCYAVTNATYVGSETLCVPNKSGFNCAGGGAVSGCAKQQTSVDCGDAFKKCGFDVKKGQSIAAFANKNLGGCAKCLANKEFGYCHPKGPANKDVYSYCCSL
ncbi:hypothetical protein HXX76_000926 [Chlamydomonas incerta]|uniref:SRCR domain-containing protein n=1 Tax=Chlamydomonas incerta TaxID=51695 RepID=A0A835WF84_CHLIN|nr:hypothetical protein HXX76_000926 [Chlamydomonas incerta]|eukprot:KAG2446338.1 hypothetical protein HXX76_000926 [Chlamydomonas incerta]